MTAWTRLHAPINVGGQIPTISHWFACVTSKQNGGGGGTTTGNGSAGGGSTSAAAHIAGAATTTDTPGAATNLAFTGFADEWLIWVGALLLLVGVGAMVLTRTARRRS